MRSIIVKRLQSYYRYESAFTRCYIYKPLEITRVFAEITYGDYYYHRLYLWAIWHLSLEWRPMLKLVRRYIQRLSGWEKPCWFEELIQAQGGGFDRSLNVIAALLSWQIFMLMKQVTLKSQYLLWHFLEILPCNYGWQWAHLKSDSLNYETGIVFEKKVGDAVARVSTACYISLKSLVFEKCRLEFEKCHDSEM